ncbi:hypothetical protein V8F33_001349 [Rhypophila sp. PSN 637]
MHTHFRITQVFLWTAIYISLILAAPFGLSGGPPAAAAFDFQYRIFLQPPNRHLEPNDPSPGLCIPNDKGDNLLPHTFSAQSGECVSLSDILKPSGGSQSAKIDSLEFIADQIRNGRATLMTFCGEACDQQAVVYQTTGRTCYTYYELRMFGGCDVLSLGFEGELVGCLCAKYRWAIWTPFNQLPDEKMLNYWCLYGGEDVVRLKMGGAGRCGLFMVWSGWSMHVDGLGWQVRWTGQVRGQERRNQDVYELPHYLPAFNDR